MSEQMPSPAGDTLYCFYHPNTPTTLRCNRCDRPICTKDAVRTPTGYRCRACVRQQQDIFFNATPVDYVIAAAVALAVGYIGQLIVPRLGFFIIFIGPLVGGIAGEVIWRLSRKRRGRYVWLAAVGALTLGALVAIWPRLQFAFFADPTGDAGGLGFINLLWNVVYFVLAAGGVIARLRLWRR